MLTREYLQQEKAKYETSKMNHLAQANAMDGAIHAINTLIAALDESELNVNVEEASDGTAAN